MWKERFCSSFPMPYYLPHSDKRFRNAIENRIHVFCMKKKWYFETALKPLTFCQKFNFRHDTGVHSFPTVYRKPHLGNVGGSSTQHSEKFRSNNSGSKIAKNAISSRPESKIRQRARFLFKTGIQLLKPFLDYTNIIQNTTEQNNSWGKPQLQRQPEGWVHTEGSLGACTNKNTSQKFNVKTA